MKYILLVLSFISCSSFAIDNPDAPDRIAEFESRIQVYENKIDNATSTLEFVDDYYAYEQALDKELNIAYKLLSSKLDATSKALLKKSQIQWIKYRDNEFDFIIENWNRESSGSSFIISRGVYKTEFIKSRVIKLLQYSASYL